MRFRLYRELKGFFDLLFPAACPLCHNTLQATTETPFCQDCTSGMSAMPDGCCSRCALPFVSRNSSSHLCESCSRFQPSFLAVHAAGIYEGQLRKAVHRFKYENCHYLDRPLGIMLREALVDTDPPDLIVPVPLHRTKLRERTYNQSLLLAKEIGQRSAVPVSRTLLKRVRNTPQQQGLSALERAKNLRNAFICQEKLSGERILLVDDVMTTGATATTCSRVLVAAGASEVNVAVVARAGRR